MLIKAHGKINLSLDITGRRADGYHFISSVMQSVSLHDDVEISKRTDGEIVVKTNHPDLQDSRNNIAFKACLQMMEDYNLTCGFDIFITKRIPVAGGMAGGSTNAAAVIRGINALCDLKLTTRELMKTGLKIGADVPFCIYEAPAIATGIGEVLEPTSGLPENMWILLVNPGVQVSTKTIYEAIDSCAAYNIVNTPLLISALEKQDVRLASTYMKNIMEPITENFCPTVKEIIHTLKSNGAMHAMMTGSGATCFGLYDSEPNLTYYQNIFPDYFVYAAKPYLA